MNKITPRTWAYIFAGLGLLALVLLAISLNSMQMAGGKPFSFSQAAPDVVDRSVTSDWMRNLLAVFRVLMITLWVLLPLYVILLIVSKEARKRLLRDLGILLPILVLLYLISRNQNSRNAAQDLNSRLFGQPTIGDQQATLTPPTFIPPPHWVTTAVTVAIALIITLVLISLFFFIMRRARQQRDNKEPLKRVAREAQAALDALSLGGDLRGTILRCYLQMMEVLNEYRGIRRGEDMTPHEFETYLEKRGIPYDPLHRLTRLFEEVRYSDMQPGRKDEQEAIASLSAIVSACQRMVAKRGHEA